MESSQPYSHAGPSTFTSKVYIGTDMDLKGEGFQLNGLKNYTDPHEDSQKYHQIKSPKLNHTNSNIIAQKGHTDHGDPPVSYTSKNGTLCRNFVQMIDGI